MSSKSLFNNKSKSKKSFVPAKVTKVANTVNQAGGSAYSLSDKAALAQLAMTGCFNGTFYASAQDQLKQVLDLANKADPTFLAKLAVYARQKGLMKDSPAVLSAVVAGKDSELLAKIFSRVVDGPKMLRNFVQVIRSGATGRKSLGTRPKKLIQDYLNSLSDEQLFKADVGNDPSLQDIIKLVHPKPNNKQRSALYGYLLGKDHNKRDLCSLVKDFENFKKELSGEVPDVPFQLLTALKLTKDHWAQIAKNSTWNQARQNLNTFERHGLFADQELTNIVADKLANPELVKKAKVFPYQLFTAFKNVDAKVPAKVTIALQKAAEVAVENVPSYNGKVYVLLDVSGSMHDPVTGNRGTVSTKMRCIDVAALVAASVLRKNPEAEVIPFSDDVVIRDRNGSPVMMNPLDSIMTNANYLSQLPSGGTNCSAPLKMLNHKQAKGDVVIYVSDNQSWVDNRGYGQSTNTMAEWNKFKTRNPNAKLVCIDIAPYANTQAHDREDVLNVGGFSDQVFSVIARFAELGNNKDLWVSTIESIQL